jgi:hypothetical protein
MKNRVAQWLIGACAGPFVFALAGHAASGSRTNVVEVRQGAVLIGGNRVSTATTLTEYHRILGKPDRTTRLKNNIYTYDKLGILLYQRPGEETISAISLDFVKWNYDFSPKNSFQGAFVVDGRVLRSDFPQSALPSLRGVQIGPTDKTLKIPVRIVFKDTIILTFDYLSSHEQLDGVGIAWQAKGEQDGAANGSQPNRSETNRTSSSAGSPR